MCVGFLQTVVRRCSCRDLTERQCRKGILPFSSISLVNCTVCGYSVLKVLVESVDFVFKTLASVISYDLPTKGLIRLKRKSNLNKRVTRAFSCCFITKVTQMLGLLYLRLKIALAEGMSSPRNCSR